MIINYKLYLTGDLHVGSGVGLPGVIDEYVVRDQDGFPLIPGSEIKGILRDNCVKLLKYTDRWDKVCDGQRHWHDEMERLMAGVELEDFCAFAEGEGICVLCSIFGSPAEKGNWWFSPATYSEAYRNAIKGAELKNRELRLAYRDMAVSAHASIDNETKRAKENHLFSLEVVRVDDSQQWEGSIEIVNSNDLDERQLGWLTASLLFTRRIGGKRRRGWGRCRFGLNDSCKSDALAALENAIGSDKQCAESTGK